MVINYFSDDKVLINRISNQHTEEQNMSDINDDTPKPNNQPLAPVTTNPFSNLATGLVETTFAETLGLSMHNAIVNQQSSQMTTSASVTNACARLLQVQSPQQRAAAAVSKKIEPAASSVTIESEDKPPAKKRFKIRDLLKPKNKNIPEDPGAKDE
jgi:hypothetical protein